MFLNNKMANTLFPKNRKGNIPITILTIGVVLVCTFALYTFLSSRNHVRNSFVGIGVIEDMNSQIEQNYFYKQSGMVIGTYSDINGVFAYAKENNINEKKCNCGEDCDSYASMVVKSASENEIPNPLLLLSIMMQESTCVSQASSGSSIGLMQINLLHCGKYGLPSDKEECKNKLIEDVQLNIDVGTKILKDSYNTYKTGKIFQEKRDDQ